MTGELKDRMKRARDAGHRIAIAHNHPGSSIPSLEDIGSVRNSGASFGVIACHDGPIIKFSIANQTIGGYALDKATIDRFRGLYKDDEKGLFAALETCLGVRIERFA